MTITPEEEAELKRKWTEERIKSTYIAPTNSKQYFVVILVMVVVIVSGVALVEIFTPEAKDTTATIAQIIGLGGTFTAALLAYMKSQETHTMVNSGLHEWIDAAVGKAFSAGKEVGNKEANDRTDALQAQIPINSVQMITRVKTGTTAPLVTPAAHESPKDKP